MDISKLTSLFHDGFITVIEYDDEKIIISMVSAEILPQHLPNSMTLTNKCIMPINLILSAENRITGKLHIEDIEQLLVDNKFCNNKIQKKSDIGGIHDFELQDNTVELLINWTNYPPNKDIDQFSEILIKAGKIDWENIPNLEF